MRHPTLKAAAVLLMAVSSVYAFGEDPANLGAAPTTAPAAADAPATLVVPDMPVAKPEAGKAQGGEAAPSPWGKTGKGSILQRLLGQGGNDNAGAEAPVEPALTPPGAPAAPVAKAAPSDAPEVVETKANPAAREGQAVRPGQVSVSDEGRVEIHVGDANLLEVLKMLSAQSQKNIIASKDVRGAVTANLYDVTVREALDAILHANGYGYREKGNFIYVYTVKELADLEKSERVRRTEVFRLFYTPSANAVTMVKPVLSDDAAVSFTTPSAAGIATGTTDTGGNTHAGDDVIVITDYPENLEKARSVFKEVDRRPQQILVEATILRASLTEDNSLGVDFTLLGGVDFSGITGLGGNSGAGVLSGNVLNNTGAGGVIRDGFGGASTGFTGQVPTGGMRVGLVTNNIAVFLQALEATTDTTVLANPKILALNRQKGEVIVGRKDGYLTTTVTSSSSVQTVEFLDTGTRLIFRPFIGDDGYIRMEIHPEDSSGGLTSNANLPFKITTEVTSNVMVKDGRTIVIGGLFRESSDSARSQVPFLGNLPLAGPLFRNQRDRTTREEVIILLTPHIIKDDEGYAQQSEEDRKQAEKLRVGVRRGMMPIGRERLADAEYERAQTELRKPNPDRAKAMWHINSAINLNPKFAEAIKLREELSGQEMRASDNSGVRSFVRRRVMAEKSIAPTTVPAAVQIAEPASRATPRGAVQPTSGQQAANDVKPAVQTSPAVEAPQAVKPEAAKPETAKVETPAPVAPVPAAPTPESPSAVVPNPPTPAPVEVAPVTPANPPVPETPAAVVPENVTPRKEVEPSVVELPKN